MKRTLSALGKPGERSGQEGAQAGRRGPSGFTRCCLLFQPLLKVSVSMRDSLILVLRKAMFAR